jgi:hypothetical protein
MSFFTLSTGNQVQSSGSMDMGGGDIPPIPNNTNVLAAIDEAKWDEYDGSRYISLRWNVLQPAEYANRKIFQKVQVAISDPVKRDKAIAMLAAIDANAGGKIVAAGVEPTDQSLLLNLANRPMVLNLQVWEIKEDRATKQPLPESEWKRGNWVSKVAPRSKGGQQAQAQPQAAQAPAAPQAPAQQAASTQDNDTWVDDIPF